MESKNRFNLMDAVIVLFVVFFMTGLAFRFLGGGFFGKRGELDRYEVRFSVSNIAATSEKAFVQGDTLTLVRQDKLLGTLVGLESVAPAKVYLENDEGEVVLAAYPEGTRIDVVGLLWAQGNMDEKGFMLDGTVLLSPGMEYQVQSEHMDFVLKILDIKWAQ